MAKKVNHSWDKGFDGVKKRQALSGLDLTPAERLNWLYQMILLSQKSGQNRISSSKE